MIDPALCPVCLLEGCDRVHGECSPRVSRVDVELVVREQRFVATVVCPSCGAEHVGSPSAIPEFCGCGKRFWSPVKPRGIAAMGGSTAGSEGEGG